MPVYRCNKCAFVAEVPSTPSGGKVSCARCATVCTVFETVFFVEKLAERYFAALREVESLKQLAVAAEPAANAQNEVSEPIPAPLDQLNLHNTAQLATAQQHQPLKQWFAARQIEAKFDYSTVDTTGFFDDAARALGQNYALFAELLERVRYAYRNSHSGLNLELASLSQKDGQAINNLCRLFYSHTLFSRYHYQKPEKIVRLTLQSAVTVRQFFEGGWLEWFVFVELLEQIKVKRRPFSCARGVKLVFANQDLHEVDVMALVDEQTPIYIECKTGEFRREIDKFIKLKKRLNLSRSQFIICACDLSDEQASGLSAMYDISFANLASLPARLQAVL